MHIAPSGNLMLTTGVALVLWCRSSMNTSNPVPGGVCQGSIGIYNDISNALFQPPCILQEEMKSFAMALKSTILIS